MPAMWGKLILKVWGGGGGGGGGGKGRVLGFLTTKRYVDTL